MALYRCSSPSGGGGSCVMGTTLPVSTANTSITINTGLTEINRFVWFAKAGTQNKESVVVYDKNTSSTKHSYASCGQSAGLYNSDFLANAYSDAVITSISGGTVVITTARNSGAADTGYWFAC